MKLHGVLKLIAQYYNKIININKDLLIKIYIRGTISRKSAIAFLIIKVYIIKDLKANLLISIDILVL